MPFVLIRGPSYRDLDFQAREGVREAVREKLEASGIRFVEYGWVWDEDDRCLLTVGRYDRLEDARQWIRTLESLGFEICVRETLPGMDQA
jgi:hypothetical protein